MRLNRGIVFSVFLLVFIIGVVSAAGPAPVNLGTAGNFAILAQSAVTSVPTSIITGNVGLHPAAGSFYVLSCPEVVSGTIYSTSAGGPLCEVVDSTSLNIAVNDKLAAYNDAAGRAQGVGPNLNLNGGTLNGDNLAPGTYTWNTPGDVTITGDITLTGTATDVWIFQISGTLNIDANKKIILAGGAQASNIFWQVADVVTLQAGSIFNGNILGASTIRMQNGATLNGRALSKTDVTLIASTVTKPVAAPVSNGPVFIDRNGNLLPNIGVDDFFNTIQNAVDFASTGNTIVVTAGTYPESVNVNKALTLIGTGTKPIISGDATHNYIVKITANNVVFNNFEVNGGGSKLGDNAFDYGVWLTGTNNVEIKNSVIKNIWNSASNGIQVDDSTNSNIHNNTISLFHKRGIRYVHSSGTFYNNEVIGDNVDGTNRVQNLVTLWTGSNVEVYNNKLHNALTILGVIPTWTSPAVLVSSYNDGSYSGGEVSSSANVHNNEIYDSDTGVVITSSYSTTTDSSSATITNNSLHDLAEAVNFETATGTAVINQNDFINNTHDITYLGAGSLNAEYNWFGTTNSTLIATMIDGTVDTTPFVLKPVEQLTLPDTTNPTVASIMTVPQYVSCSYGTISNPILVQVGITDANGVNYARLNWRYNRQYYSDPFEQPLGQYGTWQTQISLPPEHIKDGVLVEYNIYATDNAGNSNGGTGYHTLFTYDCAAPVTTDSANTAWINANVPVTLTCTDANCNQTYYSTDGSSPTTLYAPFTLSATGQYQLKYYSTDKAGNIESVKNGTLVRIDKVIPVTSDNYANNNTWMNSNQVISLSVSSDGNSPIAWTRYCEDTTDTCNPSTGFTYSGPVTIPTEGITYFRYASADTAGNIETTHEKIVKIDKTLPTTAHAVLSNWYSLSPITINLIPSNDGLSPVTTNYKVWLNGNSEPASYTQGNSILITVDGRYNLEYYSQDSAGNIETPIHTEINITGLDTLLPTVTISPVTSPTTLATQTITGTFTETNIASIIVNSVTATLGTGTYSATIPLVEGNNLVTVTATDQAGNIGTASSSIVKDTTPPIVSVTSSPTTDNIFLFQVTSTATDGSGSGVKNVYFNLSNSFGNASIYQQMSNGTGAGTYQSLVNLGGLTADSYTLTVTAIDNAGNIGTATPQTFVIANNVAPSNILPIGSTNVPITGGTVNFQFLVTERGSNKVRFGMDNIAGFTPSAFNATISSGGVTVPVGDLNYNGAGTLTLADLDNSTGNTQGSFVLSLTIPSGMVPGNYPISYNIGIV